MTAGGFRLPISLEALMCPEGTERKVAGEEGEREERGRVREEERERGRKRRRDLERGGKRGV
eukprot:638871-Amorphochlora_amoeboformis.AAC.2